MIRLYSENNVFNIYIIQVSSYFFVKVSAKAHEETTTHVFIGVLGNSLFF